MKAVNLATRPFVNRRPVIRVATLVWVLALALSLVNLWRYGDFFRSVAAHRSTLGDLEKEINLTEEQNAGLRRRIEALKLDENNVTALYLNGLIHQRVFPWSRLFDDIEDVLPKDVYLTGLSPEIEKVEAGQRRTATTARSAAARNSRKDKAKAAPKVAPAKEKDLDRVAMTLGGFSRSDEAMLELVDRLYASPTFLDPELAFERRGKNGLVNFAIRVTYLTRARPAAPEPGALLADGAAPSGEAGAGGELAPGGAAVAGGEGGGLQPDGAVAPSGAAPGAAGSGGGGLYGQPGWTPPAGADSRAARQARPGFEPDAGGAAPSDGGGSAAPRTGAAGSRTGAGQPEVIQPGFPQGGVLVPGAAPVAPGRGGVVVPPRRTPTGLLPTPSASPGGRG